MPNSSMSIDYTVQLWREGSQFLAHAMPLDVIPDAARRALDEAVGLFLKTASDLGTLEQVLEDAGYAFRDDSWEGPAWLGGERHTLCVGA